MVYAGMLFWRLAYRIAFCLANGGSLQQRHVLIIGAGPVGLVLMGKIVAGERLQR